MRLKVLASLILLANIAHANDGLRADEMGDLNIQKEEYDVLFGTPINQDPEQIQRMEDLMGESVSMETVRIDPVEPVAAKPIQKPKEVPPVPQKDVAWSEVWGSVKETGSLVWFKTRETTRTTVNKIAEKTNNVINNGISEDQKASISNSLSGTWDKATSMFKQDSDSLTYVEPKVESREAQVNRKAPVITRGEYNDVPVFKVKEVN